MRIIALREILHYMILFNSIITVTGEAVDFNQLAGDLLLSKRAGIFLKKEWRTIWQKRGFLNNSNELQIFLIFPYLEQQCSLTCPRWKLQYCSVPNR